MVDRQRRQRSRGCGVSPRLAIPELLRRRQAQASDPRSSAWVSANAGSGKTHVLAQRVLRLLLDRTPPSQLLCVAYTKAAAANMAERVFGELARWTSLDDEALTKAILDCGVPKPEPHDLTFARQLFARTIETPGGLKIQTLHAFAERLLKLFPFEANVPAHFKVSDERESALMLVEARDAALAELGAAWEGAAALDLVAREAGARQFDDLLKEALSRAEAFGAYDDPRGYAAALRCALELAPDVTAASVEAEMLGGEVERQRRETWARQLEGGSSQDRDLAESLRLANGADADDEGIAALLDVFFTKKNEKAGEGAPKADLTTKALRKAFPALDEGLRREQERLLVLRERRRAAWTLERSVALFTVAKAILATFARMKAERGALDFNDQIMRAMALLTRSSAAWVLHKLDYGLDHLLLDEAQDASAPQWSILAALSAEFFAGGGARAATRTVFAVGDEKQSIFAFQGAAPEMFAEMKRAFAKRHRDAGRPFVETPLNFSFRSSQTILDAVDKTFASEAAWRGVAATSERPPQHEAIRGDLKGVVQLWPPIRPVEAPVPPDWRLPLDHRSPDDPAAILAKRIAHVIKGWVSPNSAERVADPSTGAIRGIRESDVMILVRSRNAFFDAMVRELKAAELQAAGADRLKLNDHIAIMDLIAAGRAALLPDDDLTLAAVLKSPLIGLNDDQLLEFAARRRASLAEALADSDDLFAREAARRLAAWRARAKALTPFSFYARLLGEDGGRKALIGRLGPEAADPIDEFLTLALAHERREAPSLVNFLAEVDAADAEIKHDMDVETEGVRVLTVHASKGLEAPIVFLPDTCTAPDGRHDPKLMRLTPAKPDDPPLYAWAKGQSTDSEAVAEARREAREAAAGEHRRLLYVAMTRAAQRLIVAGYESQNARPRDCWYNLVEAGLAGALVDAPAQFGGEDQIRRFGEGLRAENGAESPQNRLPKTLPKWPSAKAKPETAAAPLGPSRLGRAGEGDRQRILEGRLAHALIEMLPEIAPERRADVARGYLDRWGGGLAEPTRAALAAKVLATLGAPELAPLFGAGSRGEVPLAGLLPRPGRPDLPYSGRLDRMLATGDGVSIVDFKLGAKPDRPAPAHVAQLALHRAALQPLYPGLPIRAALVYLDGPASAQIGDEELEAALEALATAS
jgi:ATP-dependent helicase/nuclease subunit A